MKYYYIVYNFMTENGVSGISYKVCEGESITLAQVIRALCELQHTVVVLSFLEITKSDFDNFSKKVVLSVSGTDYRQRLLVEREELSEKTTKLNDFLQSEQFKSLVEEKKCLLIEQYKYMYMYFDVLTRRCKLEGIL